MEVNPTLKHILPNLSDEQVKAINQTLADIGVESTEDLKKVREDDIVHILKLFQAMNLIKFWQNVQGNFAYMAATEIYPATNILQNCLKNKLMAPLVSFH